MSSATDDKSLFLKECIADAFFRLLQKKKFNKITVDDIVSTAGVGRMTYFRNFNTRDDIVQFKLKSLSKAYHTELPEQPKTEADAIYHLLKWIYTNKEIFTLLYRQNPFTILIYFGQSAMNDRKDDVEDTYKVPFFAVGFSGLVCAWIEHNYKETTEELHAMIKKWLNLK